MTTQDLWSDNEAQKAIREYKAKGINEDLALRTYSARLLGSDRELVLHGGGNTSVKTTAVNIFNEELDVLCVKGSGWDLATIEPEGHPAVILDSLRKLRELPHLSDEEMVSIQRSNLINPSSPNPSVETLLHAFLPHKFVDHTHSISLLALANQSNSNELCQSIYGNKVAIVPYVMPGFDLAIAAANAYEQAQKEAELKNEIVEGMILLNHGLFSFGETAKQSYQRMIKLVKLAESKISRPVNLKLASPKDTSSLNRNYNIALPYLRGILGRESSSLNYSNKWVFEIRSDSEILKFLDDANLENYAKRGVATPDHVIRTKSFPWVIDKFPVEVNKNNSDKEIKKWMMSIEQSLKCYIDQYNNYFSINNRRFNGAKKKLDPIPRLIAFPGVGLIGIGRSKKAAIVTADIGQAWISTVMAAESIGEYRPVSQRDTFDLEYWSLEQAKLGKSKEKKYVGNIVVITGAGGVIGAAIARAFANEGAEIVAIDIDPLAAKKTADECGPTALPIQCDLTDIKSIQAAFSNIKLSFGGLDILISNAGSAYPGNMSDLDNSILYKSMDINLYSHHYISQEAIRVFKSQDFLEENQNNLIGGQILFNISKQSINPGPGFGAYGISKAALLALMRQYAIEEGSSKIRSNGVNADRIRSGLLDKEMIQTRSISRGLTEEEYMSGNLLKLEVKAEDVAYTFLALASMHKTTGALITVDGGNTAAMVR